MKFLFIAAMVVSLTGLGVTAEAAPKKKAPAKTKAPEKATAPVKAAEPAPVPVVEKPVEVKPDAVTTQASATESKTGTSTRTASAPMRFGLGLGTNLGIVPGTGVGSVAAIRVRAELTPKVVGNFDLGFRSESGDFGDNTGMGVSLSGQYRVFTNEAKNLHFHVLGGLGYTGVTTTIAVSATTSTDVSASDINLFGGVGAEYFFGGANQFSMQVDVGPSIHLLSVSPEKFPDQNGTTINLAENLSSGILFTYYFDTAKKKTP